jgi:phosphocarrier protein
MSVERDNTVHREEPRALSSVILSHAGGLHARPAIKVTQLAKRFAAQVWVGLSETGPWTDAKSVARVMAMKTPTNTRIFFTASGADASQAVDALVRLVNNDFVPVDA